MPFKALRSSTSDTFHWHTDIHYIHFSSRCCAAILVYWFPCCNTFDYSINHWVESGVLQQETYKTFRTLALEVKELKTCPAASWETALQLFSSSAGHVTAALRWRHRLTQATWYQHIGHFGHAAWLIHQRNPWGHSWRMRGQKEKVAEQESSLDWLLQAEREETGCKTDAELVVVRFSNLKMSFSKHYNSSSLSFSWLCTCDTHFIHSSGPDFNVTEQWFYNCKISPTSSSEDGTSIIITPRSH